MAAKDWAEISGIANDDYNIPKGIGELDHALLNMREALAILDAKGCTVPAIHLCHAIELLEAHCPVHIGLNDAV